MLQYSLVMTVSDQYVPLPEIGIAVLEMPGCNREVVLIDVDAREALNAMLTMPSQAYARPALENQLSSWRHT
jgi:2-haloacid dehalogenase